MEGIEKKKSAPCSTIPPPPAGGKSASGEKTRHGLNVPQPTHRRQRQCKPKVNEYVSPRIQESFFEEGRLCRCARGVGRTLRNGRRGPVWIGIVGQFSWI
jgi:hypothetical protein